MLGYQAQAHEAKDGMDEDSPVFQRIWGSLSYEAHRAVVSQLLNGIPSVDTEIGLSPSYQSGETSPTTSTSFPPLLSQELLPEQASPVCQVSDEIEVDEIIATKRVQKIKNNRP